MTEQLKVEKPMLWVGRMNEIQTRAREIVYADIIYKQNVIYRILKLWQSKIKTLPATIMIRCVLFHNDFGNSLCYNKFNLQYRAASTNLEFD